MTAAQIKKARTVNKEQYDKLVEAGVTPLRIVRRDSMHRSDNHVDRATQAERPNAQDDAVDRLANAMCMVMNELAHGSTISDYVKAEARVAMQPFLLDDNGDLPDIEWAQSIVAQNES